MAITRDADYVLLSDRSGANLSFVFLLKYSVLLCPAMKRAKQHTATNKKFK